jgi:hypothetical protein
MRLAGEGLVLVGNPSAGIRVDHDLVVPRRTVVLISIAIKDHCPFSFTAFCLLARIGPSLEFVPRLVARYGSPLASSPEKLHVSLV